MPAAEVAEWHAFYQIDPFGSWRDNYHSATIAHILGNVNRQSNSPKVPMEQYFYMTHEEARRLKTERTIKFFRSKVADN